MGSFRKMPFSAGRENGFVSQNALFSRPRKWLCFAKCPFSWVPRNGFVSQKGLVGGSQKMASFRKTPLLQPVPTNPAAVPDMAPPTRPRAGSPAGGANGGRPVPAPRQGLIRTAPLLCSFPPFPRRPRQVQLAWARGELHLQALAGQAQAGSSWQPAIAVMSGGHLQDPSARPRGCRG